MFWNSNSTKMNPWISILFLLFKYYNVFTLLPTPPTFFFHFFSLLLSFLSSLVLILRCIPLEPPSNSCSLSSLNNMIFTMPEPFSFISIHVNCTLVWYMPFDRIHWNSIFILVCACFVHAFCIFFVFFYNFLPLLVLG